MARDEEQGDFDNSIRGIIVDGDVKKPSSNKKKKILFLFFLVAAVAATVALVIILKSSDDDGSDKNNSNESITSSSKSEANDPFTTQASEENSDSSPTPDPSIDSLVQQTDVPSSFGTSQPSEISLPEGMTALATTSPTASTDDPTVSPTAAPTRRPSDLSTTAAPTPRPTTTAPSPVPTETPTLEPSPSPTMPPTAAPSTPTPTEQPTTHLSCYSQSTSDDLYDEMCELYCNDANITRSLPDISGSENILFAEMSMEGTSGSCWNVNLDGTLETSFVQESNQRLVFQGDVSNLVMKCQVAYQWKYTFFSGEGIAEFDVSADSVSALWASESPDFEVQPPESIVMEECNANVEVTNVELSGNPVDQIESRLKETLRQKVHDHVGEILCQEMVDNGSATLATSQQSCY